MRAHFRTAAVPCGLLALGMLTANAFAQQPTPRPTTKSSVPSLGTSKLAIPTRPGQVTQTVAEVPAKTAKVPRPEGVDLVVEELSPELEAILTEWERKSAQIKSISGKHTRVVYNLVFEVEKLAEGKFYLETPDKGRIDLVGLTPKKGEVSKRRDAMSGRPFRLEADRSERWICNGEEILMVNEEEKSYEVAPLPKHLRGTNIVNGPLPFLFGMKAEDTKLRYHLELLKSTSPDVHTLKVVPRFTNDANNYKEAFVRLEKTRFLPTAVKLVDPSGNLETVYTFTIQSVNDRSIAGKLIDFFGGDSDPFHPNMKKYKLVVAPQADDARALPANAGPGRPSATNGQRSNGTGGSPAAGQQQATRPGTSSLGTNRK